MHRLGGRNEVRSSPPWRRGDKEAREGGGGAIYFKVLISLKHKSSGNNYVGEQLYEVITRVPCPGRSGQRGGDEDLPRVALPPLQLHQPQSEGEPQGAHPQQVRNYNTGQQLSLLSVYNFHMTLCLGTPTLVNHSAACSAVNICPAEAVSRCTYHRSIARNRR